MTKFVVIAGPSGSGKNTVINLLMKEYPHCDHVVTATTRSPRAGEIDGKDYYFFTEEKFDEEIMAGNIAGQRFVPLFGGIHYGIYLPDLRRRMSHAQTIFAPVDITGMQWLKENYPTKSFFIMPESLSEYRMRIHARNPDMSPQEFESRMKITEQEIHMHAPQYDYRVVNTGGALQETASQIVEILRKEGYTL